jgi:hypothetical protein
MWRSRKLIIAVVLAGVILAGSIGGIVLAADNGDDNQPDSKYGAILDRVGEIYQEKTGTPLDLEALKDAFAQAQAEMRTEALQNYLQNLVDQGKLTQDEADQYFEWWQSRPDVPVQFGFRSHGGFGSAFGFRCEPGTGGWLGPSGGLNAPTE